MQQLSEELINLLLAHQEWVKTLGQKGMRLHLEDYSFIDIEFSHFIFSEAILPDVTFNNCKIINSDFYACNLASTKFINCFIDGAIYVKSNLDYSTFESSAVRNTDFTRAQFCNSNLLNSQFISVNFQGVSFSSTLIKGCNVEIADFSRSSLDDVQIDQSVFKQINAEELFMDNISIRNSKESKVLNKESFLEWLKETSQ